MYAVRDGTSDVAKVCRKGGPRGAERREFRRVVDAIEDGQEA